MITEKMSKNEIAAAEPFARTPDKEKSPTPAPVLGIASYEDFIRLPGLFRRWEIEQVVEPGKSFHLEVAGDTADGTTLFAVYRRDRTQTSSSNPNPKKEQ